MRKYLILILLSVVGSASAALVTAPKKGVIEGNRFLFVVDTSSSMDRLEQSGRQVVFDIMYSGIEGRMQDGDTFGVWTFGSEVKAGVFPMRTWVADRSPDLSTTVREFLKEQSNKGRPRLETVIEKAEALARAIRDVDILIITSAGARFKGDDSWAVLQQSWDARLEEARKNKKAIIVALAARSGRIAQATLSLQGETLQLAAPPERRPAQVTRKTTRIDPMKPVREPIILRGTTTPKPIDEIPTKFVPPPTAPTAPDPLSEPAPVPVLGPQKPVVQAGDLTVAAREPGKGVPSGPPSATVSSRMLIIAGASLMLIAGALGCWIVIYVRSRNRTSYISRSMVSKPGPGIADR